MLQARPTFATIYSLYHRVMPTQMHRWNGKYVDPDQLLRRSLILVSSVCIDLYSQKLSIFTVDTVIIYLIHG